MEDISWFTQKKHSPSSHSDRKKNKKVKPVQQIQSENDVCVCDVKFDEVMRDGLSLYPSKLTWGTQTLQRSSENMIEYKDTNETIKE